VRDDHPSGTVTFLFTDVEGSTRLLHELGAERYANALAEHRRVIREAAARYAGVEMDTQGDAFFLAFPTAFAAADAARSMIEALASGPIQVRIGLHTGTPLLTAEGYVGNDVHVAARIAASSHGGQVVLSRATRELLDEHFPLRELGDHRLKDISEPVSIFQLGNGSFPPLKTISNTNLPRPASSFLGREEELVQVHSRLEGARLVTLTGPGGAGKTRLALEAAAAVVPSFAAGVFWVDLAPLRDPGLVVETVSQVLGARNGLAEHIGEREMLLLLDNLEHVIQAAPELSALVNACSNLKLLVTSRELLRVEGEVEYAVPPLALPEAVSLFCERAQAEPSEDIVELCTRLDALPLAVELAAARAKALSPAQILDRLASRLDLSRGRRDVDPRQQTLRATIEWSYDLLSESEQQLFRRLSVFAGGSSLEAAEDVAGADVDTLLSLVEKSLLRFTNERYRMLETIREYAAERLESEETAAVRRRHRAFMVTLAEASAEDLHNVNESATSARLAPDYANVRAAVSYALAEHEPDDVGIILGGLYPFLTSHGHLAEALEWAEAALAARERLSTRGLAETLVGGGEMARFSGHLDRAIELKEELVSMHVDVLRPNWRAATLADLSEIALAQDDLTDARRYAEQSAAAGGGARVHLCLAELELRVGDLRVAEENGLAALAGLEEGAFNHACGLEILGETARRSGDAASAREYFARALRSFADLRDGGGVADCLEGLSRMTAATDDVERAGRLLGAAQGLRETRGRRPARMDVPLPDVPEGAMEEGRDLAFDEAVEYALEEPVDA
jgi:predicted ATPase